MKICINATTLVLFVAAALAPTHSRAEEIHAATGQLLDWETPDAWGGKGPANSGGASFVIGQQAQLGPLPLPKARYIISVWKGGDVRLDPQNKQNEMGGLSAKNLAVEAGACSDFTQMVPGGNPSDVSRYFLNT